MATPEEKFTEEKWGIFCADHLLPARFQSCQIFILSTKTISETMRVEQLINMKQLVNMKQLIKVLELLKRGGRNLSLREMQWEGSQCIV